MANTRVEKDSMGNMEVPNDAYYDAKRRELLLISQSARIACHASSFNPWAKSNVRQLPLLENMAGWMLKKAKAIVQAAEEVASGSSTLSLWWMCFKLDLALQPI